MSNVKTIEGNHNQKSILLLTQVFTEKRNRFVSRLGHLDDATQRFHALHPRLQIQMRAVDIAFFAAEHDDHHLATMREIWNKLSIM